MRKIKFLLIMLAIFLGAGLARANDEVFDLSQLSGEWVMQEGEFWAHDSWGAVTDKGITGSGQSGVGDKTNVSEKIRIAKDEGGHLTLYVILEGEAAETPFKMVSQTAHKITFENLANAFPQRVSYERDGAMLHASIMMADGSEEMKFAFHPKGRSAHAH